MSIDLEQGLAIKIEGSLGKFQTLPVDSLINIAQSLQELVFALVNADVSDASKIELSNFKIELCGYLKSSSVPQFVLTPRINNTLHNNLFNQRSQVSKKLDEILAVSNSSDFNKLKELYPDVRRNKIIESFYSFTSSFDDSPTSFGTIDSNHQFASSYELHKLKKETKESLLIEVKGINSIGEEKYEFAEILTTKDRNKTKRKILATTSKIDHSISYSPDFILTEKRKYIFNFPLISSLTVEKNSCIIRNDMLDIYAVGKNESEAVKDFGDEFDYLYQRLNTLENKNLSDKFIIIKQFINYFVKQVAAW